MFTSYSSRQKKINTGNPALYLTKTKQSKKTNLILKSINRNYVQFSLLLLVLLLQLATKIFTLCRSIASLKRKKENHVFFPALIKVRQCKMKLMNEFECCTLLCSIILILNCVRSSDNLKQNDQITTSSRTDLSIFHLIDKIFMASPLVCGLDENNQTNFSADRDVIASAASPPPPPPLPIKTFVDLYEEGVQAYLANDWEECADKLERSVNGYHDYYNVITSCRIECEYKRQRIRPLYDFDINNLQFFESIVRKTLCLEQCKQNLLPNMPKFFFLNKFMKDTFAERKPYEYLQLCYFRVLGNDPRICWDLGN